METGPTQRRSTVLAEEEEAMVETFRRHRLLPPDDCLHALQSSVPHRTRSGSHRCLQRSGISRLKDFEVDERTRQKFKRYPFGFFRIDMTRVQTAEGDLFLFADTDRTPRFAVAQRAAAADRKAAHEVPKQMVWAVLYRVHTVPTGNAIQFAGRPRNRNTICPRPTRFDMICGGGNCPPWVRRHRRAASSTG